MSDIQQDIVDLFSELITQLSDPQLAGPAREEVLAAAAAIKDPAFQNALKIFDLDTATFLDVTKKLTAAAERLSSTTMRSQITKLIGRIAEIHSASQGAPTVVQPQPSSPVAVTPASVLPAPAVSPPSPPGPPVDPETRDTDLDHLHPVVRAKVKTLQGKLDKENIPMKVFEAFRSPERQAFLYSKGRTRPGLKVTNAEPWESYHQYGLAADFVRFENGKWNWNDQTAAQKAQWARFHALAREVGLEPLSWEMPHVQLVGTYFAKLLNGDYPEDGDESWSGNLSAAIGRWPGSRKPPLPESVERPPLPSIATASVASVTASDWVSHFGGDAWRYDGSGVYTRAPDGTLKLWRTAGAPLTSQEIFALHGAHIMAASAKHNVPPALIVMTIATETAAFRNDGFTGPNTFRWEQGYTVNATGDPQIDGKEKGDYSAGPMQVLSDTARWMNSVHALGYDASTVFKFFKSKPAKAPADVGLYDPATCIDVGTAYIRHNMAATGDNPLLVAAAYNAGSVRPSSENRWRIHCHGNHLDRAAEWFGDACAVLNETV